MAYSRTTPLQVIAQVGAGAAVLGAFGYGLFLKNSPPTKIGEDLRTTDPGKGDVLLELEKEAQQSSGKFWFGKGENSKATPPG